MYQIGFNLFYCLKCAVTTGHSIVVKCTESETLKHGPDLRKDKRHQAREKASTKLKYLSKVNDNPVTNATVQADAVTWSVCALLRH
ncbi:uncharacterized protein PgNI_12301 [Pyricularia grisea]|uniref:Uncharacterized protein n=1 Tax=Pyricularia grisea TaxID=148305 RepID=A0A6P8AMY8_PYRGI|nr:uncharacterized protein PgNI_12301 [Pyricularia grisea]TLD03400.1 hypothetical protein PgNI_12301 [Pyricularia grisea]